MKLSLFTGRRIAGTVVALAAGVGIVSQVAQADLGITLADTRTFMIGWSMNRRADGTINCGGICRTSTASDTYVLTCPINLAPQASTAACLTGLAAACTTATCQ